jgi:hypothetical protein
LVPEEPTGAQTAQVEYKTVCPGSVEIAAGTTGEVGCTIESLNGYSGPAMMVCEFPESVICTNPIFITILNRDQKVEAKYSVDVPAGTVHGRYTLVMIAGGSYTVRHLIEIVVPNTPPF